MTNLVNDTLKSIEEYIPGLINATDNLIELFREEDSLKAFELFPVYIEGVDWIIKATVLLNNHEDFFTIDMDSINSSLEEINEGISLNDYILLADLLEYEIKPFLKSIQKNLSE